ncbi:MAG: rRNA maturation RNase YbeY [Gammaproteobacteria bacterium]|nr:rRNA maturation RNase YbeY [Gammaproteobacteria bacterium]
MATILDLQIATNDKGLPIENQFKLWLNTALNHLNHQNDIEITIRIVSAEEITELNNNFRGKNKPTNILSFPAELPNIVKGNYLGDLVICADIINEEALQDNKKPCDHFAHITIHGLLHLLGFDHETEKDAEQMEKLEIDILKLLNIDNPYTTNNNE